MMESQHFIFDGIHSKDMNLHIVKINSSGFVSTPLWGTRDIQEKKSISKLTPYHYGVTKEPISFELELALLDEFNQPKKWTSKSKSDIAKWLLHDSYKEFKTYDDLTKVYYGIFVDESNLQLINNQGYMELTLRTNSPYAWTDMELLEFDLSDNTTTQSITVENRSNVVKKYRPKIEIELIDGETNVSLKNTSDNNREFKFVDLIANEVISIDNDNELILSNKFGSNPLAKFNEQWLELVQGENIIEITGKAKIKIKNQFPVIQ